MTVQRTVDAGALRLGEVQLPGLGEIKVRPDLVKGALRKPCRRLELDRLAFQVTHALADVG